VARGVGALHPCFFVRVPGAEFDLPSFAHALGGQSKSLFVSALP
jgi:hypothetical protein